ncbi:MAG: SCO family protein [Bacteroidetes bacterium]|nr:SCO family protein [Bacteroidota bacterium]
MMIKQCFLTFSIWLIIGCTGREKELPIIGEWSVETQNIDGIERIDSTSHKVPFFQFTDQHGYEFASTQLDDKVFVAYFFFTSCPTICYQMTLQMRRVQEMTDQIENFDIVSFTVDPKRDTPEKLLNYANKFNASTNNWHFLTGVADTIYHLGWNGLLVGMGEDDESPGGFIHSERFILVDKEKQIRGMYNGTDAGEVAQLVRDVKYLMKNY